MTTPVSWIAAVTARLPNYTLKALTNEDNETQTVAVDQDVLGAAIDDARGKFQIDAGQDSSLSDPTHVACVIQGVLYFLKTYKAIQPEDTMMTGDRFFKMCRDIRGITIAEPGATSDVTPSQQSVNGSVVRPDADRAQFSRYLAGFRNQRSALWAGN